MSPLCGKNGTARLRQFLPIYFTPDAVGEQDFIQRTQSAIAITAQQQLLIFTKVWAGNCVAMLAEPFDSAHPGRVREVKSLPGAGAYFFVRNCIRKQTCCLVVFID